jgi:signal transduction histidine kinase
MFHIVLVFIWRQSYYFFLTYTTIKSHFCGHLLLVSKNIITFAANYTSFLMKNWLSNNLYTLILTILLVIVVLSVAFTTRLANKFAEEEYRKIELWAEATRQLIVADEDDNIDLILSVMEGNTTIPVYMVDSTHQLLLSRNVREPKHNKEEFYKQRINDLRQSQEPIVVQVNEEVTQYIYYEDSTLLRRLYWFPYVQLLVIVAFIAIAVIALIMAQRSEQNSLWVGLSKETAHQLGTPISSLNAWNELLKATYPDDALLPQMDEDIRRLQMIAERFSKIGSQPTLDQQAILPIVQSAMEYMRVRTSNKITYTLHADTDCQVKVCQPLFEWVIENLCKNAIDSMEGKGEITLSLTKQENKVHLDITDTGKGIDRRHFKTIFKPGYTSKKRGWGLGLSLTMRIIEDYHRGKLFVEQSQIGVGSTFRITLEQAKDC